VLLDCTRRPTLAVKGGFRKELEGACALAGAVAELFGLQWQAMIQGLAFMSHQLGSFLGAYGGGLICDQLGSCTLAWRIGVAVGLAAGIVQVAFALIRPTRPPLAATA
jgi:hypothetical protein